LGKDAVGLVECNEHSCILWLNLDSEHPEIWIQRGQGICRPGLCHCGFSPRIALRANRIGKGNG
jgi:hypothetical protein